MQPLWCKTSTSSNLPLKSYTPPHALRKGGGGGQGCTSLARIMAEQVRSVSEISMGCAYAVVSGLDIRTFFQECNFLISYINIRTFFVI